MHTDLTFITNEQDNNLRDRFAVLIKDSQFFDVLVGYFYTSGFCSVYPSLEKTEKIRILIGISTNRQTYDLIQRMQSHKEISKEFGTAVKKEMECSENNFKVEEGVRKFLEWLKSGKLEIRAYPEEKIHSKLYIMTFDEEDRDTGRVITGSSNFTQSGLVDNLEFNVELKSRSDYDYAKTKFEELWRHGVDVSEDYIETIKKDTWLRDDILPYELYLKFLYEYFKEEINEDDSLEHNYRPDNFKELKYQDHAVINARKILEEYGGVFLSDVVGLGKTFMGTMLCQEIKGRTLVLAPPHLIDEHNQGSWENAFRNFGFRAKDYRCRSIGGLNKIIEKKEYKAFDVILIDEAHRFRTEETETYAKLAQICRGKKVILVTATPYNNSPKHLLAQIKLFQRSRKSSIPTLPDLEGFFKKLEKNIKGLDRQKDKQEYISVTKKNAKLIREKVLKFLMVRRTRKEIIEFYGADLEKQGMQFPEISDPKPVFYEFNKNEDNAFFKTIEFATKDFKCSRYTPLLYSKTATAMEKQSQRNMMSFMKMLLIKRLESSFFAFSQTLNRFIKSYERFVKEFKDGNVFVSAKHIQKVFEYLDQGDLDAVNRLVDEEKAERFSSEDFDKSFLSDLESDLEILRQIEALWDKVERDPKILAFQDKLLREHAVQKGKSIIFTESQETAKYLERELQKLNSLKTKVIRFSGSSSESDREEVISNFDANAREPKNKYKILITTDVLAEGVNLHSSNVVINYDIPWNPTRIMQRVGRINRVDTKHKKIHTYTFFPTDQSNDHIKLRECAEAKITAFITLLGSDAKLLTDNEEVEGHSLFDQLFSKESIEGESEEESEMKYLQEIRRIRDESPDLFEKIKRLPKKARTSRISEEHSSSLITYFRKGKLQKFFKIREDLESSEEIDFIQTAQLLNANRQEKQSRLDKSFYVLLEKNSAMLKNNTEFEEENFSSKRGSRDNSARLSKILKTKNIRYFKGFTEVDERYLAQTIAELDSGGVPKKVAQKILNNIQETPEIIVNPLKLVAILKRHSVHEFFESTHIEKKQGISSTQEIILSEYFNANAL